MYSDVFQNRNVCALAGLRGWGRHTASAFLQLFLRGQARDIHSPQFLEATCGGYSPQQTG
jgi:hypothetical protein